MDRRCAVTVGITLALATATRAGAADAQPAGRLKLTVLYGAPKDPDHFERYYFSTHMPIVIAAGQGIRMETARGMPGQDGAPPAYYRIFEAWFESPAQMASITSAPGWAKAAADVPNYASGGFSVFVSRLD
jgi:uncharacterized protein (TIGR02118 family)